MFRVNYLLYNCISKKKLMNALIDTILHFCKTNQIIIIFVNRQIIFELIYANTCLSFS